MDNNKENTRKILTSISILFIVALAIFKYDVLVEALRYVFQLVSPFLLGMAIAFIFNIPMSIIEEKILDNIFHMRKGRRVVAYLLTLIVSIVVFAFVLLLVIPELVDTIASIFDMLPGSFEELKEWLSIMFSSYPSLVEDIKSLTIDAQAIETEMLAFIQSSGLAYLSSGVDVFSKMIGALANFFIAFVFSIYLLLQKEVLVRQIYSLLKVTLPNQKVSKISYVYTLSVSTFKKFFTGQFLEALILGGLFFISMSILRLPYALLISILISVTALVPIFGAFLGCIIGILLIVVVNPTSALIFLVLFLVLQQLEGNLIYPQVVGGSIGLPSIWVFVAVTLGASIMGVVGMILFIPISSIIYALLKEFVASRSKS